MLRNGGDSAAFGDELHLRGIYLNIRSFVGLAETGLESVAIPAARFTKPECHWNSLPISPAEPVSNYTVLPVIVKQGAAREEPASVASLAGNGSWELLVFNWVYLGLQGSEP